MKTGNRTDVYPMFVLVRTGASRDLEDCLDLAVRKRKAGGEPKPTENLRRT